VSKMGAEGGGDCRDWARKGAEIAADRRHGATMTMSMDRTAKFGAGRPCAHGLEANARGTYSSNSSHLSALQLLVDIAARMPLEPQPLVVNVPAHQHHQLAVRLPPLHDILAELPIARKRSWSDAAPVKAEKPARREKEGRRSDSPGSSEASPRCWPLSAKMSAKQKRPIPVWPENASELCRGVNDCWNSFQRAHKGRSVSTADWRAARAELWAEYDVLQQSEDSSFLVCGDIRG